MHTLQLVVADASTARFYIHQPDHGTPQLTATLSNPSARKHERDLVSSRPGRVVDRSLGHTQAFDPRETAKHHALEQFATQIAQHLRQDAGAQHHGLVVIAADRLLGMIEHRLDPATRERQVAAIPRDLARLNATELAARLQTFDPLKDSGFDHKPSKTRKPHPLKSAKKLHAPTM